MDTKYIKERRIQQKGHVIRVDNEVWKKLEEKALEMKMVYASRNETLRKILGLEAKDRMAGGRPRRVRPTTR